MFLRFLRRYLFLLFLCFVIFLFFWGMLYVTLNISSWKCVLFVCLWLFGFVTILDCLICVLMFLCFWNFWCSDFVCDFWISDMFGILGFFDGLKLLFFVCLAFCFVFGFLCFDFCVLSLVCLCYFVLQFGLYDCVWCFVCFLVHVLRICGICWNNLHFWNLWTLWYFWNRWLLLDSLESLDIWWLLGLFFVGIFWALWTFGSYLCSGFLFSWNYKNHTENDPNVAPKWPKHDLNMTPNQYLKLCKDGPRLPLNRSLLNRDPYIIEDFVQHIFKTSSTHTQNLLKTYTTHTQNIHKLYTIHS